MSLEAVRVKSEQVLFAVVAANYPGTKIRTDNITFQQPTGAHWVDFKLSPGKEETASLGSTPTYFEWGVLNITVLAPENAGTKTALEMVESIKNAYRNRRFSLGADGYLTFSCVTIRNRGMMNGHQAWGVMVEYRHSKTET